MVNWEGESRLAHEQVARYGFKGGAGSVGLGFVVAGDYGNLAAMFDTDLSRAENMAGRMEGNRYAVVVYLFTIRHGTDLGIGWHTMFENTEAFGGGEVMAMAGAGVIGMGVGDDGSVDGLPGVDVKIAWWAEETTVGEFQNWVHGEVIICRWRVDRPTGLIAKDGNLEDGRQILDLPNWYDDDHNRSIERNHSLPRLVSARGWTD